MTPDELRKQLRAKLLRSEEVAVPGYDGPVTVTELTASQRIELAQAMTHNGAVDETRVGAAMLLATAYGLGLERKDVPLLERDSTLVMAVGPVAMRISGLTDEATAAAKNGFGPA